MILDSSIKLEAVLAGAVSANQPEAHVLYSTWNNQGVRSNPLPYRTALNSNTDVTILAAPVMNSNVLEVDQVFIYNKDTAAITVTIKTDDGTTERIVYKTQLATTETLAYERGCGWYVLTSSGAIKQGSGVSGPSSATDNAVARFDGNSGQFIQNSAFIVDDSGHVTSFGGNITFPASQSASAGANTLDDYEEGTWTPAITFVTAGDLSVVYSTQVGEYTKIGDLATCYHNVVTSTFTYTTASGNFRITGWPFTSKNTTGLSPIGVLEWQGITKANYTSMVVRLGTNSAIANVAGSGSGQTIAVIATGDMPTGGNVVMRGSMSFYV